MIFRFLKYSFNINTVIPLLLIIIFSITLNIKKQRNENHISLIGNLIFQLAFMYSMIILVMGFNALAYAPESSKSSLATEAITNFLSLNFLAGILNILGKTSTQIQFWISRKKKNGK